MRWIRCASVVAAAALTTGCLSSSTIIKIKSNGSGTIDERMLMNTSALDMLSSMGGEKGAPSEMFSEQAMKEAAAKMGPGVKLVSTEPLAENAMKGTHAVYAFDDVNAIQVNQGPNMPGGEAQEPKNDRVVFKLDHRGGLNVLTITMPQPDEKAPAAKTPETTGEMPPEAMGMMKMMLKGLKVAVAVEVDGKIVKTNAQYRTDTRVTLVDVDFDELMKDEANFKTLQGKLGPGTSPAEMEKVLRNIKGVKVNTEKVLTIEWK